MRLGSWLKNAFVKGAGFVKNKVIPIIRKVAPIVSKVAKVIPHPIAGTIGNIADKVQKGAEFVDKVIPSNFNNMRDKNGNPVVMKPAVM